MKSLVTGGSGYFGTLLVEKLLARGHEVRNFDLVPPDAGTQKNVQFFKGDIRDASSLKAAAEGCDYVFHNVAQVPLAKNRDLFWQVNADGTKNILEVSLAAGVKKMVYTSSSAVFGVPSVNPVTEEMKPQPQEEYGRAKYKGELLCSEYSQKGLDVSIIRPRTILGHGRLGIFQILFEWIREGSNVPVLGSGDNIYQFVHADDLAESCALAAERAGAGTYNIGAKNFGSMRQVLEHLCDYAKTGSKVKSVPMMPAVLGMKLTSTLGISPLGAYHALMYGRSMYFDISKAESELGFVPQYSNNEMFVDSYDWYLKHREEVLSAKERSAHKSAVKQGILAAVSKFI